MEPWHRTASSYFSPLPQTFALLCLSCEPANRVSWFPEALVWNEILRERVNWRFREGCKRVSPAHPGRRAPEELHSWSSRAKPMDFSMPLSAPRGWDSRAGNRQCCKNLIWKLFTGGWISSTAVFDTNKKPCLCPKQFQLCGTRCDYITQMWEGWCSANLTCLSKSFLTCSRRLFCFLESVSYFLFFLFFSLYF